MRPKSLGMTLTVLTASATIITVILVGKPTALLAQAAECKTGLDAIGTCFGFGPNGKCSSGCSGPSKGPGTSGIDWLNKSVHIHNGTGNSINGATAAVHCRRTRRCLTLSGEMLVCDLLIDKCLGVLKPTDQQKYDPPTCTEYRTHYDGWVDSPDALLLPCPSPAPTPLPSPETESDTPPDPLEV